MYRTIENKIRFNVVLIYIVVAVICGGMLLYVYKFRLNVDSQKREAEQYNVELLQTDRLIRAVNQAQSEANLYVVTKYSGHLRMFRRTLANVEHLVDSLKTTAEELSRDRILQEVSVLLKEKEQIVSELNRQFNSKNPLEPISERLRAYEPVSEVDSLLVTSVVRDTVVHPVSNKFWKRLAGLFVPDKKADTVVTITTLRTDTLKLFQRDSLYIVSEMSGYAEQASRDYVRRITAIEKNVSNLIIADQEISSKISDLLIELYSDIIQTRLKEIQESKQLVNRNNTYTIVGGVVALGLILLFIILIIHDVNKGYAARKALEQANVRTRQIMDSRHKLLLSVSHDIKTPLNSILGYLELRQSNRELSLRDISSMWNSGKHILALLENLLEFSSLEQGTLRTDLHHFNLLELCREVVEMFELLARQKKLAFDYEFDLDPDLLICSDSLKMKQIIINILSNSIKYTVDGGVRFRVNHNDDKLAFCIADTGAGIPKDCMATLFKPFSRVEENNTLAEGSGLGLYVVKGLIDLLGGEITVASDVGKGTQIEVVIPAKIVSVEKEAIQKKLLVVDDDVPFLTMVRDMLLQLGHEVSICSTMVEFDRFMKHIMEYDIVLTDMEMGSVSGVNIMERVRGAGASLPVIVMTARSDFSYDIAITMGFDNYLCKPVTMGSFAHLLGGKTASDDKFKLLDEMFGGDREAINEILSIFVHSTTEHIILLRQALAGEDYVCAQALCHKMLPMFMQIGADEEIIVILKKVDSLRGTKAENYPQWKEDIAELADRIEALLYSMDS